MSYVVVAIPLNRPEIVDFLTPPNPLRRGAKVRILGQRPSPAAERAWIDRLQDTPTVETILTRDNPHNNLMQTTTDRLVPVKFLREDPEYLTRSLGGWSPVYFGVMSADDWQADPVLRHAEVLVEYGERIQFLGTDAGVSAERVTLETGYDTVAEVIAHIRTVFAQREAPAYLDRLYDAAVGKAPISDGPVPLPILLDAILGEMVRLELTRRYALADGDTETADNIATLQTRHLDDHGLRLVYKGEYIMGRHRRSSVLLMPELGLAIKQPAPEPFHEIAINARTYDGRTEHIPAVTQGGTLVTAGGRVRLTTEGDKVGMINRVFGREIQFCTLLGVIIEPFVKGPTLQDYVLADRDRLTADHYESVMLHQQVCELLDAENGDWHSANFMVTDSGLVHIDWGAARPLEPDEHTPELRRERIEQVQNIAFSFHDPALAERVNALHNALVNDESRLNAVTARARELIEAKGVRVLNPDTRR